MYCKFVILYVMSDDTLKLVGNKKTTFWNLIGLISITNPHILGQFEDLHCGHIFVFIPTNLLWTCDTENVEQTTATVSEENQSVIAQCLMTVSQAA